MQTIPAFHIAVFGVYPDRPLPAPLRESFTATQAMGEMNTIMQECAMEEYERSRRHDAGHYDIEMIGQQQALDSMSALTDTVRAAQMRMSSAYALAARDGWIRPEKATVIIGQPITPFPLLSTREQLATGARMAFDDFYNNRVAERLTLVANDTPPEAPIARIAHIRCIVGGQAVALGEDGAAVLLRSMDAPVLEPAIMEKIFNLRQIDTLAHCASIASYRTSPELGYGPAPEGP